MSPKFIGHILRIAGQRLQQLTTLFLAVLAEVDIDFKQEVFDAFGSKDTPISKQPK